MTLTRRHVIAGAAATVAAAALPAVVIPVESETICPTPSFIMQFSSTQEFIDFIAAGTDVRDIEWEFV